ncbi:hypothetical protein [uncultured Friedmanniella sp.]|uniref:hypothetical protein n=1 Tax=uncultured Friedmanniella sp. TaxID=335381 RepID=UPI0035CBD1D4
MSNLQPYAPPSVLSGQGRAVARIGQQAQVAVARTNAVAEIESAKLDALQQIAGRAMQGVALVSQLEQQLAQVVPLATSRLQAIGDMHALATAEVVAQAPRRLS